MENKYRRFCDMFISYKIGLKGIKSTIPFIELPFYRKVFVVILFVWVIIAFILCELVDPKLAFYVVLMATVAFIPFFIIDSMKKNLEVMLNEHYVPYSNKRMEMTINVLKEYGIDIYNGNAIDMLIEEAKLAQNQSNYLAIFEKSFKPLGAIVVSVIAFVAKKYCDLETPDVVINMAAKFILVTILGFSLGVVIIPTLKDIFFRDYKMYKEMIYDLRQVKLFCSERQSQSSKN